MERWQPISGFESRYEVSDLGRIRSLAFNQRYLLRNGETAFRRVKPRNIATQAINSGYLIAHLHRDGIRKAVLVHRLVARHFVPGFADGLEVNHVNGVKTDNNFTNLEWVPSRDNKLHAVAIGLSSQAIPVKDPATGVRYSSISQAAKETHKSARTVSATFLREF